MGFLEMFKKRGVSFCGAKRLVALTDFELVNPIWFSEDELETQKTYNLNPKKLKQTKKHILEVSTTPPPEKKPRNQEKVVKAAEDKLEKAQAEFDKTLPPDVVKSTTTMQSAKHTLTAT